MIITKNTQAKILRALALGALLLTATALPFGTAYADGPSRPLVTEETVIDPGADTLPIDAWMYDSPFYKDFGGINRVEAKGPAGDEWMYHSPFYQDFSAVGRIGVETVALEAQGAPIDAWMFDSPLYDIP